MQKRGCSVEVVTIVALLSVDTLFVSPPALHDQAAAAHMQFHSPYGDHVTLLSLYQAYTAASTKVGLKLRIDTTNHSLCSHGAGTTSFINVT